MNKLLLLTMVCFITACSQSKVVQAKPSAPLDIQYKIADDVAAGEETTVTVTVTAKRALQQLDISVAAVDDNISIVSGGDSVSVAGVAQGDAQEMTLTVQLIGEMSYVSVRAVSVDNSGRSQHKTQAIRFDSSDNSDETKTEKQTVENSGGVTTSGDEALILMPSS